MEEIKVGEYVRTRYGQIILVDWAGNAIVVDKEGRTVLTVDGSITKHSQNIIDVIDVGDYVNGYKVSFKGKDIEPFVQCDYPVKEGITNHYLFYERAIESIVTHEQFESIKYRLE